ncbi:MAG: dihydroxyacetone kinase subunit DhaK [Lawsonibacter sp.]
MKKIINSPQDVVREMCHGMVLAHPSLTWDPHDQIISRSVLTPDKVSLISGGGSGHEPAHAGFVGTGMLDAAVCGDVFASPSQIQVYRAIQKTQGSKGTLLIVKNYSGDIMNFKNAAYLAQEDGIEVDYVKVDDDIAVQDSLYTVGRRGVAGTIFVHKIAGAAAERGYDLARVKQLAQRTVDHVKTIGFAASSCTVPAKGTPTFTLGEDEIEYGVGIHGEPGIRREQMEPADRLAEHMVTQLLSELNLSGSEPIQVALLINGLGGTPAQELYILHHSVRRVLAQHPHVSVVYSMVGNYMTSIDMAGASVSMLVLDPELKELLFDPCETPALHITGPQPPVSDSWTEPAVHPHVTPSDTIETDPAWAVVLEDRLSLSNLIYLVDAMSECVIRNEVPFCELDAHAGDGDFGMSIAKGFRQLKEEWRQITSDVDTMAEFLSRCSLVILEHCGGASGPIWGSAFRAASRYCEGKDRLNRQEFAALLADVVLGIQATGQRSFGRGAVVGDKTLMDALIPCAELWHDMCLEDYSFVHLFRLGAEAAVAGAQRTEQMVARMGRAGTVGKRSLSYPDAGAHALGVIFTELAEKIRE